MGGGFHRASLSISLDFEFHEFRSGDPHVKRVYWHEKLHFFQLWAQGYLAHLALLEWQYLVNFQKTGETAVPEELASQLADFFYSPPKGHWSDPEFFSAWNLSEALTRFWDICTVGFDAIVGKSAQEKDLPLHVRKARELRPKDLSPSVVSNVEFDYLMQIEDWYARPYQFLFMSMHSRQAALLFPLAAHFALQSKSPVKVYVLAVERLQLDFDLYERLQTMHSDRVLPFGPWNTLVMAGWWPALAPRVQAVCEEVAREVTGAGLTAGWDVVERTALKDHPIYGFMNQLLGLGQLARMTRDEFASRLPGYPQIPYSTAFAIPGSPLGMALLKDAIQPPLVIFSDRNWAPWESFAKSGVAKMAASPVAMVSLELRQIQEKLDRVRALEALKHTTQKTDRELP
jgi:hypothetical protein